jgi:hypothetical protein
LAFGWGGGIRPFQHSANRSTENAATSRNRARQLPILRPTSWAALVELHWRQGPNTRWVYNRRVKAPVVHAVSVITRSLWVRSHMSLILLMVLLAGIGSSVVLRRLGVRSMPGRYVLAVLLGYALFLLGVRLWLWYAQGALPHLEREVIEVTEGTRRASMPPARGSHDGSALGDLGTAGDVLGYGGDGCMVAAVAILIVVALGGMVAYILAAAPEVLGEAVVQLALTAALRRKGKVWDGGHWTGSVFRATWAPTLVTIVAAVIVGLVVQARCPSATTLFDALSGCP